MRKTDLPSIAILGAGPIGLEAALYARTLHYPVTIYERGRVAEHVQRWGHVRLFSPFGMNVTPLGLAAVKQIQSDLPSENDCITGRDHFKHYLQPLSQCALLKDCFSLETQVLRIGRAGFFKGESPGDSKRAAEPFRLLLRDKAGKERVDEADIVLDCTGTYAQHRWLGDGGIPALGELAAEGQIVYGVEDVLGERQNFYAGKNVLVVGGGFSAATTVSNLATLAEKRADTWVIWLARSTRMQPIKRLVNDPLKERDRLAMRGNTLATRTDGNVEFHPGGIVDSIISHGQDKGFQVKAQVGSRDVNWNVDRVVANIGYTPDTAMFRELQVHECYASLAPMKLAAAMLGSKGDDCLKQTSHGPDTLRNPEPNFFILGAKSFGRNSNFLMKIGFDQVREVFTLISGQAGLDLYKKK